MPVTHCFVDNLIVKVEQLESEDHHTVTSLGRDQTITCRDISVTDLFEKRLVCRKTSLLVLVIPRLS